MGKRFLKESLINPLIDPIKINKTSAAEINEKLHDTEVQYIIQHSKGQKYEDQSNAYLRLSTKCCTTV
jgi:hypothetical protein